MTTGVKKKYWNDFYASVTRAAPQKPSQFAAFAAGEVAHLPAILEFGCGNGRDAEFFGHLGFDVKATDASSAAIELCQQNSQQDSVQYECLPAHKSAEALAAFGAAHGPFCVYGRFFLHAITEKKQRKLLQALSDTLPKGSVLAFEYRSLGDAQSDKAFGDHYRRFLDHNSFCKTLQDSAYDVLYQIEGQGFAKYKTEDAVVGRVIARKR